MFTSTQVLISLSLLSSVVLSSSITKDGIDDFGLPKGLEQRIYGGQEAARGQFPYQVKLQIAFEDYPEPLWPTICGGSILTNRFILTTALCLKYSQDVRNYRIVVGAHENEANVTDGTIYNTTRLISHEGFIKNETAHRNDIALLQTATIIQFNNRVRPIALHREFIQDVDGAIASGYGSSNDDITNLKFVQMSTLTNTECRRRFALVPRFPARIHDWDTLCAFSGRRRHGICHGDMGGPLTLDNRLIGVSAWALTRNSNCGQGIPDGFMRISTYLRWIESHIYPETN